MNDDRKTRYVVAKLFDAERLIDEAQDLLCHLVANCPAELGNELPAVDKLWRSLYSVRRDGNRLDLVDVAFRLIRRGESGQ